MSLTKGFNYVMLLISLMSSNGEASEVDISSKPNWIIVEGGTQIKGIQLGRYLSPNLGLEAGYLTYSPRTWQISSSRNTISIFSALLRTSYGPLRAGIGPAFRSTSGSERCKYDIFDPVTRKLSYVLGPPITWEMQTIDVESTVGFLWPISNFRLGFNVITWGRQFALYNFEIEGLDAMMSESLIQQIETKLRKDTYTVMTATLGLVF